VRKPAAPNTADRGHVIRLDPTFAQANALARVCGVSRFVYNWGLSEWDRQYKAGEKPTAQKLKKQFNAIKREQWPWISESPRDANSQPFADLGRAYSTFYASCKGTRRGRKIGRPTYRKRGVHDSFRAYPVVAPVRTLPIVDPEEFQMVHQRTGSCSGCYPDKHDSFYVANDKFKVWQRGKRGVVRLPVIGDVRMREPLRWQGKILSARVFRRADQWFIAINVETRVAKPHVHTRAIVGVDLGLRTAMVPSHGDSIDGPKPLRTDLQRLARANRELHRRKKGGTNRNKSRIRVARIHQRIANIRKDWWHKVTTDLCRDNQTIVIEDLQIDFMRKNRRLSRAVLDVAPGMFRPTLLYKAAVYGSQIILADRRYPSTQRCSGCGNIKRGNDKLGLGVSAYLCMKCGYQEDRDRNVALNLEQYPRLEGNWSRETRTSMDDRASTSAAKSRTGKRDPGSGN
jgi:putative transposase